MHVDSMALTYGFVGLAAGVGAMLWQRKVEMENRCDFLTDMDKDLTLAFDNVGIVLQDKSTPKPIREAILFLLSAHADRRRGSEFADTFIEQVRRRDGAQPDGSDPISQSMSMLGKKNPSLARLTHHVLASLSFGLVFLNLPDDFKVERIKTEAARDPVSLWARIARLFGPGDDNHHHHHPGGKLIPV